MSGARDERGQVFVLSAVMLTAILGMTAFVLDVGSWFRAQRQMQATADASALAGAQALPDDTATASQWAVNYANDNGGGVAAADVTFNGSNQISSHRGSSVASSGSTSST
jgi:Flp pilus assembly protein TadG